MTNCLLVTLDFINDIVHADGKIAHGAARIAQTQTIDKANQAINFARAQDMLIAHVKVGFCQSYVNCPSHSPIFGKAAEYGALKLGSWGTDFHEALHVAADDVVVVKQRISAFYNTHLDNICRAQQIGTLVLCGVSTNMAVEATARDGHDRDYKIIVLADACQMGDATLHEASLQCMQRFTEVMTVEAWTQA